MPRFSNWNAVAPNSLPTPPPTFANFAVLTTRAAPCPGLVVLLLREIDAEDDREVRAAREVTVLAPLSLSNGGQAKWIFARAKARLRFC